MPPTDHTRDEPSPSPSHEATPAAPLDETLAPQSATTRPSGAVDSAPAARIGKRLGKYEIVQLLGIGGMGVVYKAIDGQLEREVALKILPRELSSDRDALPRFIAEARTAGKIHSPHTVTVFDIGNDGEEYYLAMEYVTGGTMAERLAAAGPLSPLEATLAVADACRGLIAAHELGVLHRDIKPANLLLGHNDQVKVADFGLAKVSRASGMTLTQAGQVVGTPHYMSPEQCEGKPLDVRTDVYSLGATYYALLTGESPYESADSVLQVMFAHCQKEPPDPREANPRVPAAAAAIVHKAMAKKLDQRYQNAQEMLADLEALLDDLLPGTGSRSGRRAMLRGTLPNQPMLKAGKKRGLSRRTLVGAGLGGFLVVALVLLAIAGRGRGTPSTTNGSATNGSASDHSAAPVAAPVFAGEPLKVGVIHSLSGTMADSESPVVDATLLAVEELNARGGVLGRKVEAIVRDGQSSDRTFAREATQLIEQEKVAALFGCWTSSARKTILPILEAHDKLLFYPVQYEGLESSPYVVYLGATPHQQIIPALKWAYAFEDRRKFFLIGSDYVFPHAANAIVKDMLAELGATLVGEQYVPLGSGDFHQVVEQIKAAQPDLVVNTLNGDSNSSLFRSLRMAGLSPDKLPVLSFSIGEEELRRLNPAVVAGDYSAWNYFESIDTPLNHEFVRKFRDKFGARRSVTDPMEAAYVGVHLWAQAVAKAQSIETTLLRQALHGESYQAPSGVIRIVSDSLHVEKTPRIGRVTPSGEFEVVWTATKPERPVPFPPSRSQADWERFLQELYQGWQGRWSAP